MSEEDRYIRQTILPEIGSQGQTKLLRSHVIVVGAGGLGCPALQYLVAAGLGKITILDGDRVSRTNLHRQVLYRENQIGEYKSVAAKETLEKLNPEIELVAVPETLDAANLENHLSEATIVMDCADNFAVSYTLSDACKQKRIPLISASVLGMSGYVGGFCGEGPSLRALFPDLPDRAANCSTAGVMGPVVGTIGCLQAQMVMNCVLGLDPSPIGQCLTVDCKSFHVSGFRFDGAPEPTEKILKFIAPSQIENGDFVVELRGEAEAPKKVTPDSYRCSVQDVAGGINVPPQSKRTVLVCRSGLRSWQAAQHLMRYWDGELSLVAMGDAA